MKKSVLIIIMAVGLFTACSSFKLANNLNKVSIGMSRQEVTTLLGKDYLPAGGVATEAGKVSYLPIAFRILYRYTKQAVTK